MLIQKKNILLISIISISLHGMYPKNKDWERTWGEKTAAKKGRALAIYNSIHMLIAQNTATEMAQKIASDMQKRGCTPESIRETAENLEKAGKQIEAKSYRRLADIVEEQQNKQKIQQNIKLRKNKQ